MSGSGVIFDHPAATAVAGIAACLDALAEASLWSVPAGELGPLLVAVEVVARRLDAARVELTAQAGAPQVARREGATSLAALLRARADVPPGATRERLRLRAALERGEATRVRTCRPCAASAWCDAHHIRHWVDGGPTGLANGVLLCRRHHTLVHQDHWHIHLQDGLPWLTPPTGIDPTRTPRQHSRYKKIDDP